MAEGKNATAKEVITPKRGNINEAMFTLQQKSCSNIRIKDRGRQNLERGAVPCVCKGARHRAAGQDARANGHQRQRA